MGKFKSLLVSIVLIAAFAVLIFDSKTAASGVSQGLELCIKNIIPALFPFMIISNFCSTFLRETSLNTLEYLLSPCKLPKGSASIFLLGILGGYPVGAKLIHDAYRNHTLSKEDAQRMLMFCSNAGPSFIFGVLGTMFTESWIPWFIWFVHILSAYLVGIVTAVPPSKPCVNLKSVEFSITKAVFDSIRTLCNICGWITLFRLIIVFLEKWFMYMLKPAARVLISGALELSNGCLQIPLIYNTQIKIFITVLIITFGGLCITLQTAAIAPTLSIRYYIKGKVYQTLFAMFLTLPVLLPFKPIKILLIVILCFLLVYFLMSLLLKNRKNSSIPKRVVV